MWGDWAPELLPPVRALLCKYESLLPAWCLIAHVRYDAESGDALAQCAVDFKYRKINFFFGQGFFLQSDSERDADFVHELMHGNLNALYTCAMELLEDAIGDNELAFKYAKRQLDEANEAATTDISNLVVQLTTPTLKQ